MTVEIVIPWRGGCPYREAALRWVLARWSMLGWPTTIAELATGEWCKAQAVTPAVEASTAEVVVVADADVWCDGIADAVAAVQLGAGWAVPHLEVNRLGEEVTAQVLVGADPSSTTDRDEPPYPGHAGGGIVVLRRESYLEVPLDPRFLGWGHEDDSWARALVTMLGEPWRGKRPLFHLWHPPQDRRVRYEGRPQSAALFQRYRAKKGNRTRMRALLDEFVEVSA